MSLSHFINFPSNRNRFNKSFPRPKIKVTGKLLAEPLSKSYSTVGIAIDYLIRFLLKYNFPRARTFPWFAESCDDGEFSKYINTAKNQYNKFLGNGKISRNMTKAIIDLAKIDTFYRTNGYYYPEDLGSPNKEVVDDILNIVKIIDISKLAIKRRCILNPKFGKLSKKIGGAEADLIIDNKLIDIKTTKRLQVSREMLNQIIGYYFLGKLGKVTGIRNWELITELGFYFPRFDVLFTLPINDLILPKKIISFEKWFIKKLDSYNRNYVW